MGLDMSLSVKESVYGNDADKDPYLGKFRRVGSTYEVGYWRKANHIHQWFVNNVQDGNDDCGSYQIGPEKLKEFRDTIRRAIESPTEAPSLFPTQSGFFYGSTDYDKHYYDSFTYTLNMLKDLFQLLDGKDNGYDPDRKAYLTVYYSSSW